MRLRPPDRLQKWPSLLHWEASLSGSSSLNFWSVNQSRILISYYSCWWDGTFPSLKKSGTLRIRISNYSPVSVCLGTNDTQCHISFRSLLLSFEIPALLTYGCCLLAPRVLCRRGGWCRTWIGTSFGSGCPLGTVEWPEVKVFSSHSSLGSLL